MIPSYLIDTTLTLAMAKDVNGRIDYLGEAPPGTAENSVGWRIKKMTYDATGFCTKVQWANGRNNMDVEWDERENYTYS